MQSKVSRWHRRGVLVSESRVSTPLQHSVDITALAVLGEQFPPRLLRLGFRLIQVIDETGQDQFRYIVPPVSTVPAGPFLMGSDPQQDPLACHNETPQHVVEVPAFQIGTYPLTVIEYACFMLAAQHPEPLRGHNWQTLLAHQSDHPVVGLSWEDVLAYAQWLTLVTGDDWRLPTEAEWEKAARGTDGRIYPWGNDWDESRANTHDGTTTPVGSYPEGASPYGVQDLAGNVWEWTSTRYYQYPYQASNERENHSRRFKKVLRGGPWSVANLRVRYWVRGERHACVAYRKIHPPMDTNNTFGGRLVRGGLAPLLSCLAALLAHRVSERFASLGQVDRQEPEKAEVYDTVLDTESKTRIARANEL
jgi:formylglycine-generating enzyme required for sulfatase activity